MGPRPRDGQSLPGWRVAAFLTGLGLVWLTVLPPLGSLDHALLTAHMLKHLIVMTLAAPLLLLGEPVHQPGGDPDPRLPRRLTTDPVVCWLAGTVTVLVWHVPAVLAARDALSLGALRADGELPGRRIALLAACVPAVGRACTWSAWGVPLYLLLATLPCDALSAFLAFCGRPLYAAALAPAPAEQLLADQQRAGALMWVWVTLVYLVPAVWQVLRLLAPPAPRSSPEPSAR